MVLPLLLMLLLLLQSLLLLCVVGAAAWRACGWLLHDAVPCRQVVVVVVPVTGRVWAQAR